MALSDRHRSALFDPKKEKRSRQRSQLGVKGKIFFPDRQYEEECLVEDLSPDGAGLKSSCSAALGVRVVLYVDGLGRFEGSIVRHDRLKVGILFKCSDIKRERIAEQIANYVEQGSVRATTVRIRSRIKGNAALHRFVLKSGQTRECEVIDIALSGASLRTDERPPVGETVAFGSTNAVVVRHTEFGIAVSFVGMAVQAAAS